MKKLLLSLAAVFAATFAFAQTELLTNGGFEKWTDGQPDEWKSTTTASSGTLTQTTDAHSGSYAVVLKNTSANQRLASKVLNLLYSLNLCQNKIGVRAYPHTSPRLIVVVVLPFHQFQTFP